MKNQLIYFSDFLYNIVQNFKKVIIPNEQLSFDEHLCKIKGRFKSKCL